MKAAKLKERPAFQLLKQTDVQSFYHMQMPRWLFFDPHYSVLSLEAKVAYTFLLNRFQLSKLNGWMNDCGEVFIIFPREALAREMQISYKKAISSFQELCAAKLIWEKRCGRGDANQIYLAQVDVDGAGSSYNSAPFVAPTPENAQSKPAETAGLATLPEAAPPMPGAPEHLKAAEMTGLEVPNPTVQNGQSGTSRDAALAGADLPKPHTSKTKRSQPKQSHIEVSPSVPPARDAAADGLADASEDLVEILEECELWVFEAETSRVLENAIERLFYADSFRVGNATLPRERVRAKLRLLNNLILQDACNKLHDNLSADIKNSTAYTMAVIFNAIAESESDLMVDPYLNSLRRPPAVPEGR